LAETSSKDAFFSSLLTLALATWSSDTIPSTFFDLFFLPFLFFPISLYWIIAIIMKVGRSMEWVKNEDLDRDLKIDGRCRGNLLIFFCGVEKTRRCMAVNEVMAWRLAAVSFRFRAFGVGAKLRLIWLKRLIW
jgi:hypothetical protein